MIQQFVRSSCLDALSFSGINFTTLYWIMEICIYVLWKLKSDFRIINGECSINKTDDRSEIFQMQFSKYIFLTCDDYGEMLKNNFLRLLSNKSFL